MPRNDSSIEINRPAAEIFPLVVGERIAAWVGNLERREFANTDERRAGSTFRDIYDERGQEMVLEGEIIAYEPPRYVKIRQSTPGEGMGFDTVAEFKLHESEGKTRVEFASESIYRGFFLKLMSPIVGIMAQRALKEDMARLKALAEAAEPQ